MLRSDGRPGQHALERRCRGCRRASPAPVPAPARTAAHREALVEARAKRAPSSSPIASAMNAWLNASDTAGVANSSFIMMPSCRWPSSVLNTMLKSRGWSHRGRAGCPGASRSPTAPGRSRSRAGQWGPGSSSRPAAEAVTAAHPAARGRNAPGRQGWRSGRPLPVHRRVEDGEVQQRALRLAEREAVAARVRRGNPWGVDRKKVSCSPSGQKMRRVSSWSSVWPVAASTIIPVST